MSSSASITSPSRNAVPRYASRSSSSWSIRTSFAREDGSRATSGRASRTPQERLSRERDRETDRRKAEIDQVDGAPSRAGGSSAARRARPTGEWPLRRSRCELRRRAPRRRGASGSCSGRLACQAEHDRRPDRVPRVWRRRKTRSGRSVPRAYSSGSRRGFRPRRRAGPSRSEAGRTSGRGTAASARPTRSRFEVEPERSA